MDKDRLKPGDDVTISGTIACADADWTECLVAVKGNDGVTRRYWINPNDITPFRPDGNGGRT